MVNRIYLRVNMSTVVPLFLYTVIGTGLRYGCIHIRISGISCSAWKILFYLGRELTTGGVTEAHPVESTALLL